MVDKDKDLHDVEKTLYHTHADLMYVIARHGDSLAKKKGYENLDGMDAVIRFLCDKHHWLPHQVRQLSTDDLVLLLDGELEG